jgi:hypothetical protein
MAAACIFLSPQMHHAPRDECFGCIRALSHCGHARWLAFLLHCMCVVLLHYHTITRHTLTLLQVDELKRENQKLLQIIAQLQSASIGCVSPPVAAVSVQEAEGPAVTASHSCLSAGESGGGPSGASSNACGAHRVFWLCRHMGLCVREVQVARFWGFSWRLHVHAIAASHATCLPYSSIKAYDPISGCHVWQEDCCCSFA